MTNEERNTALYQKMYAEQESFKAQLAAMTPAEILKHAYEFVCREDFLLSLEYNDLSDKQAAALLKSDSPLADVFAKWEKWETDHMSQVWNCMESRANEVLRADFVSAQREGR